MKKLIPAFCLVFVFTLTAIGGDIDGTPCRVNCPPPDPPPCPQNCDGLTSTFQWPEKGQILLALLNLVKR